MLGIERKTMPKWLGRRQQAVFSINMQTVQTKDKAQMAGPPPTEQAAFSINTQTVQTQLKHTHEQLPQHRSAHRGA